MALRIAASGDSLTRTASLPAGTSPYTACGWAMVYSDRGSVYQTLVSLEGAASAYFVLLWEGSVANAGGVEITGGTANNFASRPALNTPFFWAIVGNGTNILGYWKYPGDATFVTASAASTAFTPTIILFGNSQASEWLDGQFFNVMCWNRVLTVTELLTQSRSYKPVDSTNINFWWPLKSIKETNDLSFNRRNPTVNGSPRTEAPTYLLSLPRKGRRLFKTGSTATRTVTASGGITFSGTSARQYTRVGPVSGGIVFAGTAARNYVRSEGTSTGGITFGGSAAFAKGKTVAPSGGLTFGGTATQIRVKVENVSGGITFGGAASVSFVGTLTYSYTASGGIVFSGTSPRANVRSKAASGGILFGGQASVSYFPPPGGVVSTRMNIRRLFTFLRKK